MVARSLLLLDEPFEGVAPALAQRIAEILVELRRTNSLSVLISESDAVHAWHLADDIYTIKRGEVRPVPGINSSSEAGVVYQEGFQS